MIVQQFYTITDVANLLQTKEATVRKYLRENKLKGYKVGKFWRIKEVDLENFMSQFSNEA
jgi:excisionase family DNA binding protein